MKFSFSMDSKLWRFFDYVGDMAALNLLFIVTCLPIVTIGAAVTALNSVLFKRKEKRTDDVKREYIRDFKANFKNSTIIWVIFLVFLFACGLNLVIVSKTDLAYRSQIMVGFGAVLAVMVMTVLYSFAVLARFENSWLDTVIKAFVIGILSFPYTLVIFLVLTAAVIASIQTYASIMAALAVWLLIGFALTGHLCSAMFYRAFRRFTRKEDLPEDTVDEAMYTLREQYRKEKMLKKQR